MGAPERSVVFAASGGATGDFVQKGAPPTIIFFFFLYIFFIFSPFYTNLGGKSVGNITFLSDPNINT